MGLARKTSGIRLPPSLGCQRCDGRRYLPTRDAGLSAPDGAAVCSPGREPWESGPRERESPSGATETVRGQTFCRPSGAYDVPATFPPGLAPWATYRRRSAAHSGKPTLWRYHNSSSSPQETCKPDASRAGDTAVAHALINFFAGCAEVSTEDPTPRPRTQPYAARRGSVLRGRDTSPAPAWCEGA
jgi:hypothetical protein